MESTRARVVNLTRKISQFGIVALTGLLPLMFLPFTAEFFEFNKSVLFLGIMLVVLVSWLINLAFTGTVSFWKTSFDTWILGFFAAALIALFFSQDKVASLIGFSGRMSEGILVFLFLVSMSFIVRQVVTKSRMIEMLVWSLLVSGALLGFSLLLSMQECISFLG